MLLDGGEWSTFRLPKASHSYDGAHGWNTEWPRIREIGEEDELLMTMHGMFWKFPRGFSLTDTSGIQPRSSYLKVIGDFCRWQDRIVFGCDDTAKSEFLNKRKAKGTIAAPSRSRISGSWSRINWITSAPSSGEGRCGFRKKWKRVPPRIPIFSAGCLAAVCTSPMENRRQLILS